MSVATVRPPDTDGIVCTWLAARMTAHGFTLPVGTRVPNPRPAEFLRVLLTGGSRRNRVQLAPVLTVEAWAASESRAERLANEANGIFAAAAGEVVDGVTFYRGTEFGLPANLPDPDSAQFRYTFTGELWLRGIPITY